MRISRPRIPVFRKRLSILAVLGGLLLPASPSLAQTLFSDDFSDGVITGWSNIGTDPMEESGGIFQTPDAANTDSHYSVDAGAAWTDYTFSADVMSNDDDMCGITFRIQDGSNYYLLRQTFGDSSYGTWNLVLQKVVGGSGTDLAAPVDNGGSDPGQVNSETTWYTFKVEVSGTSIRAYVDDVLKFDVTDSTYASGTAGLYLEADKDGQFDNALVVSSSAASTISSAANQAFFVSDAPTAMSTITITDANPATITAANDIRVRIPAGFNMVWNSADNTATIGGAASSKVDTTVTYEDSDATLVLNVTSNFAASDEITVSGLSFTGFTATSASDNLELEVDNDGAVTSVDDKTIAIGAPTYRSIGTNSGVLYSAGNASIDSGTSTVTFGGGATLPTNVGPGDKLSIDGGSGTLFTDDFSDGVITGWTKVWTNSLSESGGTLNETNDADDSHYIVDAGSAWTDYTVTCDILATDNDDTGISFRAQDGSNFYLLFQRFGNPGQGSWDLWLRKYVGGTPTLLASVDNFGSAPGQVNSENVWYTLKVELSGTSIKCYVDDVLKFDVTDSTYADGTVGAWCESQSSKWDNMLVTGAGGGSGDFHILSRDSDTQATVQETAGSTFTNQSYTIERAYNTMQAWEDDRQGDLAGEGRREVGVCYNDGAFTDRLVISGSTTDAAHYMRLTVADGQRHNGVKDGGARIDAGGGWTAQNAIDVEDEYTRIEWLEITDIYDAGDAISFANSPSGANGLAYGIYVHGCWQANNAAVRVDTTGVTIRNCFATGGTTYAVLVEASASATIENCTFWGYSGGGHGVATSAGDVAVRNTISVDHGTLDFYIETAGSATISYFGYNMFSTYGGGFDPGDYAGNNQLPPQNLEYLFASIGNPEDLHLEASGHRAGNTGLDLSTSFTDDIDGATRADAWDIGADEGVSGTDPLTPKILAWEEVEP